MCVYIVSSPDSLQHCKRGGSGNETSVFHIMKIDEPAGVGAPPIDTWLQGSSSVYGDLNWWKDNTTATMQAKTAA